MRPRIRIAEPRDFSPTVTARLRQVAEVELATCTAAELPAVLDACDVFWFRLGHRLDAASLPAAPRCRIVACPVTGLDHIDLAACAARGIEVLSLRGETAFLRTVRATAELTLGLILALLRRIPAASAAVVAGAWDRDAFRGHELYGKTAGLVGVGRLGTIVAGYLSALGMRVLGYDPGVAMPPGVTGVADLGELMAAADVISVHARYDAATHHLIGAAELARVQPHAVLVNTARGGVVDDRALLAALRAGRLAGAALDVIEGEPAIGADHPLVVHARAHDHLLLVPHIGGNTYESFDRTEGFIADKVVAALRARGSLP